MKSTPIRLLIEEGVISRVEAQPNKDNWQVVFYRKTTGHQPILYEKDTGGTRRFKSLEACLTLIKSLGLKKMEVIF